MIANKEQYGFPGLIVKGITIHNTGNNLKAYEIEGIMEATRDNNATHYLVDDREVIQVMPLDWCVYHTGMGIDWACKNTIAIEICCSQDTEDIYMKAQDRAVNLIKELMVQYDLNESNLYFHKDFNSKTYCPHRILSIYKTKENFIRGYWNVTRNG